MREMKGLLLRAVLLALACSWAKNSASQTWVVETIDTSYNTGYYTTIALDSRGRPHITYSHGGVGLRYAHFTGAEWSIEHLNSLTRPGVYPSIALDDNDYPYISCCGGEGWNLQCVHWTGTEWSVDTVESVTWAEFTDIALDSCNYAHHPHIMYLSSRCLKYVFWTGTEWLAHIVDTTYTEYTESPCLALDDSNRPHIAYGNRCLRYGRWTGSCFSIDTIDLAPSSNECITIDSDNYPHISYSGYGPLKYARLTPSGWSIEEVDTIGYTGLYTSIALDGDGLPHISYQHHSDYSLKYARLRVAVEEDPEAGRQERRTRLSVTPNPFTHNTVVEFVVRGSEFVDEKLTSIKIHDAAGRLVKTLVNEEKEPGRHEVTWNATGVHSQDGCATGIYFVRLAVGEDHKETKKMILVK
jgi:hypothetical protein